ncbi:hypothetical protein SUGI_0131580 [Cryptomeria japonica]|nr:hypothetical protein SUGI_0131580 [Cryptomeria japonica]
MVLVQDSCFVEEHIQKVTKPKKSKRKLDVINFNEEPIQKITKSKKARRKVDAADSNEVFYRMEFDGASKGNPGKAGAGAVLRNQDGSVICELKEGVGRATNNVAEYRAVILGLKVALSRGIQKIHVQGDSNLVCMQIQDLWKIKSQNIAELFEEAKELKSKFKEFRINHIYREFNGKADALANAAIELKNGEIKNDVATYRLDNPHEMASSSQRKTSKDLLDMASSSVECLTKTSKTRRMKSKVGLTDPNKDSVDTASPSVECLTKTSKTRRMKSKVGLPDFNKDSLDTASPSVECLTKASKTRSMKSKVGLKDLNKEMIQVSSLLEEPVGKYSKSKETRRKLKVTDSNEEPLEKPSTSRRRRKLQTDPDEDPHTNSSKKLVGKAMVSKKSRGKLDMINSNEGFYRLEFDGASKGNPGKAGAGAVLRNQYGSVICELKENVGIATNNVAEYRAIILGLKAALSKGIQRIHVQGDSKLVCMQVQDLWAVKSQNIVVLHMEAKKLISKFKEFRISHVYRELNGEANDLADAAVELQSGE